MTKFDGHYCNKYGSDKTHLFLSKKAERICSNSDPLNIYEREFDIKNCNGDIIGSEFRYAVDGVITTQDYTRRYNWVTAVELNELLEAEADANAETAAMEYYWTLDSWGSEYPPENADEIIAAANEKILDFAKNGNWKDEYEIEAFSEKLWETYCNNGTI